MYRRSCPLSYNNMSISDSETESDEEIRDLVVLDQKKKNNGKRPMINLENFQTRKNGEGKKVLSLAQENAYQFKSQAHVDRDDLVELATKYQKMIKKISIPTGRVQYGVIVNWQCLAKTMKLLYGQPLHYLTHMLCKQWDESWFESEDGEQPLDIMIKWSNAEATLWNVEQVHRLSTSPIHLAKLWLNDPDYCNFVREVIPFH